MTSTSTARGGQVGPTHVPARRAAGGPPVASGNAIRGSRVGAGPMGEAERGETAPRFRISYWCANGHETQPSFSEEAGVQPPGDLGLPALRLPGRPGPGEPAVAAAERAVQDAPGLREGAAQRRRRRGDPRGGAGAAARPPAHPLSSRPTPDGSTGRARQHGVARPHRSVSGAFGVCGQGLAIRVTRAAGRTPRPGRAATGSAAGPRAPAAGHGERRRRRPAPARPRRPSRRRRRAARPPAPARIAGER